MQLETFLKKNRKWLLIAVVIIFVLGSSNALGLSLLGLDSLFQGQQTGVVGIQIGGGSTIPLGSTVSQSQCFQSENDPYVGTSWPATCTFKWMSTSSVSPTIFANANLPNVYNDQVQVDYSVGNLVALCSAGNLISSGSSGCASVKYGNTTGYIVPYQFSVDMTVAQNSEPHITFRVVTFVNEISNFVWNNLPSGYQSVNQSSLYAQISTCSVQSGGASQDCSSAGSTNNVNIQPMYVGAQVGLFHDQNLQSGLGITCPSGNCLPNANNPFPSTYMTSAPTYFGITLSNFGAYGCGNLGLSTCWPSVHLTITVYTFLVGSYIPNSVNPNTTTQESGPGGNNNQGLTIGSLLGLGIYSIIVIAVVAAIGFYFISKRIP